MRLFPILPFLLLAVAPALADAPTLRDFRDWHVNCSDTFDCDARTPALGGGPDNLRLSRAGQETYWNLVFEASAAPVDITSPVTVAVDGSGETFIGAAEIAPYGAPNAYHFLGAGAQGVVDRLASGSKLIIEYFDNDMARHRTEFSLSGLTASLIFVDEFQKRLGSERVAGVAPEGLKRYGGEPAIPERLLEALAADPQCRPLSELANAEDYEIDAELAEGQKLYILPCWSAAYNFGSKVFVEIFENDFAEAAFPEYSEANGWTATTYLVNYSYDPETKTISSFNKARGVGDCGSSGDWQWHEYQFRLLEFRDKPDCDGSDPGEFPLVYSAK